jgi:hypothetical protein
MPQRAPGTCMDPRAFVTVKMLLYAAARCSYIQGEAGSLSVKVF